MPAPRARPARRRSPSSAVDTARREQVTRLTHWLIRRGRLLRSNSNLFPKFCERLVAAGIPLDRAALHLRGLHPRYRGVLRTWRPDLDLEERYLDHRHEGTQTYRQGPVPAVVEGQERLEWRLGASEDLPFPILAELREQGFTHYVIAPLIYASGEVNTLSWATRRAAGFSANDLAFLNEILPVYATIVELKALRRFVENMLTTYVGREPTRLILGGQVRRGDVRTITASLMQIDLRDFSLLSDRMSPRAVIRMLNEYFDCVMPPVRKHGGEIVEIMGDGVLAIFAEGPDRPASEACELALAASREGLAALTERNRQRASNAPELNAGAALHYGTVSYGNIGTGDRLDFTVIGPDVNLTSRIERLCRELDRSLIMSEAFAATLKQPMREIGDYELRGFGKLQRLYELPSTGWRVDRFIAAP